MSMTFELDGRQVSARQGASILEAATESGVHIPTLCQLDGLSAAGACRMCLVELAGSNKLVPACATSVREGMQVTSNSPRLADYRRQIVELIFSERNHVCAVCVANGSCELQDLAVTVGMDHVRYDYLHPTEQVDMTHKQFGIDQNRCVLCTRCVRACDEIEGAHVWDIAGRGINAHVITGLNEPWGQVEACTSCGKCVASCPTGALFNRGSSVAEMSHDGGRVGRLKRARDNKEWLQP